MQDLLPAGGLRLFREGVEPSGSLKKVSGYISILLLRPLPDANSIRLQEGSVLRHHGLRRARGCLLLGLPSVSPMRCWLRLEPRWYHLRPSRLHRIYYHVERWRPGTIARQLHLHHGTVARVSAQAGLPRIASPARPSRIDPYLPFT